MHFYGIAAQVIPVLCLALVFEERMLQRKPASYSQNEEDNPDLWNFSHIIGRIYLALLVTAGEVAALVGLYRQETDGVSDAIIWLALIVSLLTLVTSALSPQLKYWRQWWSWESSSILISVWLVIALVALTWKFIDYFQDLV